MIHIVVAVRDSALVAFGRPYIVPAVGVATRSFSDEVNRVGADNEMIKHPADYELYELGTYDDETGLFASSPPRLLLRAQDCRQSAS